MSVDLEIHAEVRGDRGKGASRRLRHAGKVPAILYGAKKDPQALTLDQNSVIKQLENEAFYSQILTLKVDGLSEQAILRDLQRHPYKPKILHMDFLRISADQAIRVNIPLHFINEENCRGVKQEGGTIGHLMNDVEVICLPKDLPEYIEVDVVDLGLGESIHLSQLQLSEGVELAQLAQGSEYDAAVVNVHHTRTATEEEEAEVTDTEEAGPDVAAPDAAEED